MLTRVFPPNQAELRNILKFSIIRTERRGWRKINLAVRIMVTLHQPDYESALNSLISQAAPPNID